ncbi:MAG: hypothetical protein WCJ01_01985 [Ignavibacteria bacterium]
MYEVLISENFKWNEFIGNLYFSRYFDNNPALFLKTEENIPIIICTVDIPEFFNEYPFGDNKLVIVKNNNENQGILESLTDAGVAENVFTISDTSQMEALEICELSESVIDLLKSCGEYYV